MDGDETVTANFSQIEYTLTVNVTGNGTVSRNPDQVTYRYGDVVQLTANADPGWTFSNWSGDLSGSDNPGSLTITGDMNVTANFTRDEYTLTVDTSGSGSVTRSPDQATYHYGDVVELIANADPGWEFSHWSGDLSGSDNSESITMDGNKTVTANFSQIAYDLIVTIVGDGSVTKNLDQTTYHYGDTVTLTANPDTGWSFAGWSGDLSGTTNPESIAIYDHRTVTATFTRDEYTLTTDVVGNGSVIRDPDQTTYHYGDVIELTAIPATGWQFVGWSGDLSGSTSPRSITVAGDKNITATFTAQPVTEIGLSTSPDAPAAGAVVTFTAVITPAYTQSVTYTWDFGDGSDPVVTTQPWVTHVFEIPGQYVVSFVVSDDHGPLCTHSAQFAVAAQSESGRRSFLPLIARG
jgi:uncharacterized repeat protein (TIGR02543 family)